MRSSNARLHYSATFEKGTFWSTFTESSKSQYGGIRQSDRFGVHSVDFRKFSFRVRSEARANTARAQLKIVVG